MKIFIDTAPFIYLIEGHLVFTSKIKTLVTDATANGEETEKAAELADQEYAAGEDVRDGAN